MDALHGVFTGVVVDVADPSGRGRVRLQVPQVAGLAVTAWASPAGHGVVRVGDRVSVAHDGSDRNYPLFWPIRAEPTYVPPALSWTTLTLTSKYVHGSSGGWHDVQYATSIQGLIYVRGLTFATPSVAGADVITTLPRGARVQEIFPVAAGVSAGGAIRVQSDGQMVVHTPPDPSINWLSFSFFYEPQP